MRPRIVYVHGGGPKARRELLTSQWDKALFGHDMGEASQMAYWAPVRYGSPLPDPHPDPLEGLPGAVAEEGHPLLEDPAHFVSRTLADADGAAPLGGWLRDMTYLAEALALAEEPRPGPGEEPLPRSVPRPRPARTALFRLLVRQTFEDVGAYFFGGAGPAMRQVAEEALDEAAATGDGPVVVVGHGLGSVVAYEVLAAAPDRRVDLFVTLGSPLAVPAVQECLAGPRAVPSGTALWLNASDARDLVALDHTLRPEYAPPGRITDLLVGNGSENHHGAAAYLSSPLVREPVRRVLRRTG
ncbi:hypothetical protein ACFPM3_14040 [Streptomyces coeruleoprunus]|uniref:Serine peptidase n=1 Tax=Streptomyces coeruleoprunus TaxID=285563 RepID=A0ABV9XG35_9ACTN